MKISLASSFQHIVGGTGEFLGDQREVISGMRPKSSILGLKNTFQIQKIGVYSKIGLLL